MGKPFEKGHQKRGGRKKGTPNKVPAALKDMAMQALEKAGGVDYLWQVAKKRPNVFVPFLRGILPLQITGGGEPVKAEVAIRFVRPEKAS